MNCAWSPARGVCLDRDCPFTDGPCEGIEREKPLRTPDGEIPATVIREPDE